ncbi:hypothetical protein Hdeb2414_s0008g00287651 [Helianthus debilis subsp. tardiflorus]
MPQEYRAVYPQEGDTGADAPAGYVTMWADFFGDCNLQLQLTVFVADVLEWYKLHISQLSPFGMIRICNFEYMFRAFDIEPTVGDFWRFYQMTVLMGFFSFRQRDGSPKLMTPPKGITKWKKKFFYINVAAIGAKLTFRNQYAVVDVADDADKVSRKARPVVREKSGEDAALWRMFDPDFKGKVEVIACADDEDGYNVIIRDNFLVSAEAALAVELPQGKALGDPNATGVFKKHVEKTVRIRTSKKKHETTFIPPLMPQVAGISRTRFRSYTDYMVVSDTLEGLGVPGGGAAAGGFVASSKPADEKKKWKADAAGAEPLEETFSFFDAPSSPPRDAAVDTGVNKEFTRSPSIEVVTSPSARAEDTGKKAVGQTIVDTVDSSDNLIEPRHLDVGGGGEKPKSSEAENLNSPVAGKTSGSTAAGTGFEEPSIQPGESKLEFYYPSYAEGRSVSYHRPPWNVMQGDDISNDPSTCKDILSGLGTPFEVLRARGLPRENRINQLSSMLGGSSIVASAIMEDYKVLGRKEEETARVWAEAEAMVKAAREGAEHLERERAAFEKHKQTETWAAMAGLKQVRTLAKLPSKNARVGVKPVLGKMKNFSVLSGAD